MNEAHVVEFDGRLVPAAEAAVPCTDLGLLYGIGLFETLRVYRRQAFRLQAHLDRLVASAGTLGVPVPSHFLPDAARIERLLDANGLCDARLRLTVTGGTRREDRVHQAVLLTAAAVQPYPDSYYSQGATVCVCGRVQDSRDPLQGHKSTSYWPRLQALHEAQMQGCMEALWLNERREVAEGSISNVFVVRAGNVLTPSLETPVLPGVTRAAVLELCATQGIATHQTRLTISDVLDADEVFVTNCMMALVPVVRVERHAISGERPGPIARRLRAAYESLVAAECPGR